MDMAQKLIYPAIFYPDETGGFTVDVPDLPGCVTQGDNISDAIDMAVDTDRRLDNDRIRRWKCCSRRKSVT